MRNKKTATKDRSALDIIEEATHIVRLMPARLLTIYYAGTLPFVLAFLYFWTDMSKSALAYQHVASSAFTIALLFIWMKSCHAAFTRELWAFIGHERMERWTPMQAGRLVLTQTAIQPIGFVLLPAAFLMMLPFGWAFSFFQNISVYGDGSIEGFRNVMGRAWKQAKLFPRQNHIFLLIVSLFGLFVFFNVCVVIFYTPHLLKTLFGVETLFTKAGWSVFNTTFLVVSIGVSFLVVDPLIKTVYTLRCFYGESLRSGEDLKLELRRVVAYGRMAAVVLGVVLMLSSASHAAERSASPRGGMAETGQQEPVSAEELDTAISEVINQREYEWRLPRVAEPEEAEERGLIESFLAGVFETIAGWLRPVKNWFKEVGEWISDKLSQLRWPDQKKPRAGGLGSFAPDLLMYLVLAAVACALGLFIYRAWKKGRSEVEKPDVAEVESVPDISDEGVTADEMPSDSWLQLARKLMKKGKMRLALRALFLATLAHLAQQELITIARFKSNHDYESELNLKARSMPEVLDAFAQNVRIFEAAWYGMHEITGDALKTFRENLKKVTEFA